MSRLESISLAGPVKEGHGRVTDVSKRSPWWLRTRSSKRSPTRLRQSSKRIPGGYGRSCLTNWVLFQQWNYGNLGKSKGTFGGKHGIWNLEESKIRIYVYIYIYMYVCIKAFQRELETPFKHKCTTTS